MAGTRIEQHDDQVLDVLHLFLEEHPAVLIGRHPLDLPCGVHSLEQPLLFFIRQIP